MRSDTISATVEDPRAGTGVVSVLRNITDLRRATEQIEENYQKLRIDFAGGATYDLADDTYVKGAPGLFQLNLQDQDNWSGSVFAQSYFNITDQLRLQAGVRYTHEDTEMLASTATSVCPVSRSTSTSRAVPA